MTKPTHIEVDEAFHVRIDVEAIERAALAVAQEHVDGDAHVKRTIRRLAGARANARIVVVGGKRKPRELGELAHYTTKSGERIHHPSAYNKRGFSNMVYHSSTYRVEVGAEWVWKHFAASWALKG